MEFILHFYILTSKNNALNRKLINFPLSSVAEPIYFEENPKVTRFTDWGFSLRFYFFRSFCSRPISVGRQSMPLKSGTTTDTIFSLISGFTLVMHICQAPPMLLQSSSTKTAGRMASTRSRYVSPRSRATKKAPVNPYFFNRAAMSSACLSLREVQ